MNDTEVYGQVICNVPAPHLVEQGYILPPKVVVKELPTGDQKQSDCQNLITTIDDHSVDKILSVLDPPNKSSILSRTLTSAKRLRLVIILG